MFTLMKPPTFERAFLSVLMCKTMLALFWSRTSKKVACFLHQVKFILPEKKLKSMFSKYGKLNDFEGLENNRKTRFILHGSA